MNRNSVVIAVLLVITIFSNVVIAEDENRGDATAFVTIPPKPSVDCHPDPFGIKEKGNWFTCFVEFENADPAGIDVSSVRLSVSGKTGSIAAQLNPAIVGDYDGDGFTDMMLRFKRADVKAWFSGMTTPATYTFNIQGTVSGFSFTASDNVPVTNKQLKPVKKTIQLNGPNTPPGTYVKSSAQGGTLLSYNGLTLLSPRNRFVTNIYDNASPSEFASFHLTATEPITGKIIESAITIDSVEDCYSVSQNSVFCEASGKLSVNKYHPILKLIGIRGSYYTKQLPVFWFQIKNGQVVNVAGGSIWNDIFSVNSMNVSEFRIKTV